MRATNMRSLKLHKNAVHETHELAVYVAGYAAGKCDEKLEEAAEWLEKLSEHVCAQGYIGCDGGETCTSDHK
jgi:hypothetical protein